MNNITHTTAKLAVSKLKRLKLDWVDKRVDIVTSYIIQQEKITELLGLYKSVHGVVQSWDTMPDVEAKIQRLEKELKEGLE